MKTWIVLFVVGLLAGCSTSYKFKSDECKDETGTVGEKKVRVISCARIEEVK